MSATFVVPTIFKAIDKFSAPLKGMGNATETFANRAERNFRKVGDAALSVSKYSLIAGLAIAAPLVVAAKAAIDFEDKMADVAKTTGLQGEGLEKYGSFVLDLAETTRTSVDDILKIGEIGGQLGIAEKDLDGFTRSMNMFNVALGNDFQGGVEEASTAVGNIKTLFKETRSLNIADAILKTGSAINTLGAIGSATSPNLAEFAVRIGALPDALKPTLQDTLSLGTLFEEAGIKAEISARGFNDFILTAASNLPAFAEQMKISQKAATDLLNTNPTEFAKRYAKTLRGLKGTELAARFKSAKIGDSGTMKVIGSLSTGLERLDKIQQESNKSFEAGTSILSEYETKNNTAAANISKFTNQIKVMTIRLGNELIPVIQELLAYIIPVGKEIIAWVKEHKELTKAVLVGAGILSGFLITLSIFSFIVGIVTKATAAWAVITKLQIVNQWLLNAAMSANPIGLIIIAIAALITWVVLIIKYWDEWGAAMSFMIGPLGLIIGIIQSFRRNWDGIVKAFKEGGILEGIKMIGKTILDALLMPLQQVLEIIAKVTGADWASSLAESTKNFRKDLGVNVTTDESGKPLNEKETVNPQKEKQDALSSSIEKIQRQLVTVAIADQTGRAKVSSDNNVVPVTTSTRPKI